MLQNLDLLNPWILKARDINIDGTIKGTFLSQVVWLEEDRNRPS